MIEGGQRTDDTTHDGHRVSVAAEAFKERAHLVIDHRVHADFVYKRFFLSLVGQVSVKQQEAGFEVIGLLGQLLDRITAVEQDAFVAIDVGDFRFASGGRDEAGIVGEVSVTRQRANFNHVRANGAGMYVQFQRFAIDTQSGFFIAHLTGSCCFLIRSFWRWSPLSASRRGGAGRNNGKAPQVGSHKYRELKHFVNAEYILPCQA